MNKRIRGVSAMIWRPGHRPLSRGRSSRIVFLVLITFVAVQQIAWASSAQHPAKKLTPLEEGLQFYAGKTVTLLCPASVGSPLDLGSRLLAPLMASYFHANVNVVDDSIGNEIPGQDAIASAAPNGLTFGPIMISTLASEVIQHTEGITFNPAHVAFLGGTPTTPTVWVANPSSPYTNWRAIQTATAPVKVISTNGVAALVQRILTGIYGLHVDLVTGYASPPAVVVGFVRGDGPVAVQGFSNLASLIASGQGIPILVSDSVRFTAALAPKMRNVPTFADIEAKYPLKTKRERSILEVLAALTSYPEVFYTPGGVPSDRIVALRSAIQRVFTDKSLYAQEFNENLVPGFTSGATEKQEWLQASKSLQLAAEYANS